jgi:hypothetical protein
MIVVFDKLVVVRRMPDGKWGVFAHKLDEHVDVDISGEPEHAVDVQGCAMLRWRLKNFVFSEECVACAADECMQLFDVLPAYASAIVTHEHQAN